MNNYIGYTLTFLSYASDCYGKFKKDKKNIMFFNLISKLFAIPGYFFLGSLTGSYNFIISFICVIISNIKERKNIKLTPVYFVMQLLYIVGVIITYGGISSILIFIANSITLFSIWFMPPQKMRLLAVLASLIYLLYQVSIKNIVGILEIFLIISNILSYLKEKKRLNNNYMNI